MKIFFLLSGLILIGHSGYSQSKKNNKPKPAQNKTSTAKPAPDHSSENFQVMETQAVRFSGTDEELVTFFYGKSSI